MLLERTNLEKALDRLKIKEMDTIDIHEEISRIFMTEEKQVL